jgi:hypothetical protein
MTKQFKAYIDGSGTGNPDLLVLAGYVAPSGVWADFSRDWQKRLSELKLDCFKMHEMAGRPEFAGYLYRTIEEHKITAAISCAVRTKELRKAVAEFPWPSDLVRPEGLTNPYYFGFKAITDMLSQYQGDLGIDEPVDFYFDNQSEKANLSGIWPMLKLSSAPQFRKNMGSEPVFMSDDDTPPLQAADLYAWWVRKWTIEGVADWGEKLPFPWGMKRDIRRLTAVFGEKDFIVEFKRGLEPEARARWAIEDPTCRTQRTRTQRGKAAP